MTEALQIADQMWRTVYEDAKMPRDLRERIADIDILVEAAGERLRSRQVVAVIIEDYVRNREHPVV